MSGNREEDGETARGWDVVARAKYRAELRDHVDFLRAGRHNLLEPEVDILGPYLRGARVVHLQCSHGLDALGLLNAGATSVLGIDISEEMVRQARAKAAAVDAADDARFVRADVTDLPPSLEASADLVYTGRGALPWLADLAAWSGSVARLLRPGGRAFVFEGHPLDSLWDREAREPTLRPGVGYFDERVEEAPGFPASVVARELGPRRPRLPEHRWRPGQVIEALVGRGLVLEAFRESPVLYWDQFPHWPEATKGRLPHSYGLLAKRP